VEELGIEARTNESSIQCSFGLTPWEESKKEEAWRRNQRGL
jgi:hypothetical protein